MARTISPTIGGGISGATAGSVIFAGTGGVLAQDNANLFYDNTNDRLGLMTNAPTATLTFGSSSTGIAIHNVADQTTNTELGSASRISNVFTIKTIATGSGTTRTLSLVSASAAGALSTYLINRSTTPYFAWNITTNSSTTGEWFKIRSTSTQSTASSGTVTFCSIAPTVNQSGTAAYTGLLVNATETGTGSGTKNLLLLQIAGTTKFGVDNTGAFTCSNAVTAGIAVASTHRIAVVNGGTTYYLLATTVA